MSAVEQYARAHIVTDSADGHRAVPAILHYDPEADPQAMRIDLPGGQAWTFERRLVEEGLLAPVTDGDVRVWPCGRVQVVVEFHSREGVEVVQFDSVVLLRFLRRTYAATPVPH
ncbi:SsgA family sporulation/cell division regulator [Streptomyces sp. NPDC050844]|uniref:SsgA family sporulation/cell division regulator n=1 Tax=Streptomyces sp. NPDC050844 TaxID=3155790 RepID=UPI00340C2999